jgi:type VI secretion system protein ImpH
VASESGKPAASLIEQLFSRPDCFSFVAAVQVLEQLRRLEETRHPQDPAAQRQGRNRNSEMIRYRATPTLVFPGAEISGIHPAEADQPLRVEVSFIGLNGPSGVLPRYYSETVLQQIKLKNLALRDFLDIFNERVIRNHLEASRKYRLPAVFELADGSYDDPISGALRALIGMATPRLSTTASAVSRLSVPDSVLMSYAGLFSRSVRSAAGLEQMLSDHTGRPVQVIQLQGSWAQLHPDDQTRLASPDQPTGQYAQLGVNAVLGTQIFDIQGSFRLGIGPLEYKEFSDLLPGTDMMRQIADLTRLYAGPTLAFDVQLSLRHSSVPPCVIGGDEVSKRMLGLNTWLFASKRSSDAADVVVDMSNSGL